MTIREIRQMDKGPIFLTRMRKGGVRAECHACGWWTDSSHVDYAEAAADAHQINAHGRGNQGRRRT